MVIHPVEIVRSGERVVARSRIEHSGSTEELWYSVPEEYAPYLTRSLDGFLVGVLLLGMKLGEDIVVKGPISAKLFYNLTNYYMRIVSLVLTSIRPVEVVPDSLDDAQDRVCGGAVGTGFSAGIDSFCTSDDHLGENVPPGYRLTHLVCNNVGAYGSWRRPEQARRLFNARLALSREYAGEVGLSFVEIDSNLSEVLKWDKFSETHVPRNLSAILLLQGLFSRYYYASGYRYQDCAIREGGLIAKTDPSAVHLLSTETLDCISSGCQYSRTEKTRRVASIDAAGQWLNVCVSDTEDGRNCSACWKCCRTLLTLELLGRLDGFAAVFDLARWRRVRTGYIIRSILGGAKGPYAAEIRALAKEEGRSFPLWQRAAARLFDLTPARVYQAARRVARSLRGSAEREA